MFTVVSGKKSNCPPSHYFCVYPHNGKIESFPLRLTHSHRLESKKRLYLREQFYKLRCQPRVIGKQPAISCHLWRKASIDMDRGNVFSALSCVTSTPRTLELFCPVQSETNQVRQFQQASVVVFYGKKKVSKR